MTPLCGANENHAQFMCCLHQDWMCPLWCCVPLTAGSPSRYCTCGCRLAASGLVIAKAILGRGVMLWEERLKGLCQCGCMCLCVRARERARMGQVESEGQREWESTGKEANKNSSWKTIYNVKCSQVVDPALSSLKQSGIRWGMWPPWGEARPKPEHQCRSRWAGEVGRDLDTWELTWEERGRISQGETRCRNPGCSPSSPV